MVATFLSCFVFGGFTGLILANAALDLLYHDTYFVIGHFHYVLSIAAAIGLAIFLLNVFVPLTNAALAFIFGCIILVLGIAGINGMFILQHLIGIEGHPRRIFLSPETCASYAVCANAGLFATTIALASIAAVGCS